MKLNLGCGADFRVGYINIDISDKYHPMTLVGDASDLDKLDISNNSIDEIVCIHLIQQFSPNAFQNIILNWINKLKKDGIVHIQAFDYSLIANDIMFERIDIINLNRMVFGDPANPHGGIYNLLNITNLLQSKGLKIIEKGYIGLEFFVKAQKINE